MLGLDICVKAAYTILGGKGVLHAKTLQDLTASKGVQDQDYLIDQNLVQDFIENDDPVCWRVMRHVKALSFEF